MAHYNHDTVAANAAPDPSPAGSEQVAAPDAPPVSPKDVLLSFYCSQGDTELQKLSFVWLSVRQPDLRMTSRQAMALFVACRHAAQAIVFRNGQHPPISPVGADGRLAAMEASVNTDLRNEIADLQDVLNGHRRPPSTDALVPQIAELVIGRDYQFLVNNGGRERRSQAPGAPYNPRLDPYLSHLQYYALEGHSTGSALYDDIFAAVGDYVRQLAPDHELQDMIMAANTVYVQNRPPALEPGAR